MNAGGNHSSAVKGLAIDLEVSGSCPFSFFSIPSSFFTKSEKCEHATIPLPNWPLYKKVHHLERPETIFTIGDNIHHRGHYSLVNIVRET